MKKFLCYDTEQAARGEINVDSRGMLKPVDSELSDTSTSPVQNKVIKSALDALSEEIANIPGGKEQLSGTTDELTPTQVYNAVSAGIPVKVQYLDGTYGLLSFTAFAVAESLNVIASNMIAYFNDLYILAELFGDKSNNEWGFNVTTLAQKTDIPDIPAELPNPNALTFTGAVTGSYDGSSPLSVKIPSELNKVILPSSTSGSSKKFKITVDDSGAITATEV